MSEHTPVNVSYVLLPKPAGDQEPRPLSLDVVNMSLQGQRELVEIFGWLFTDTGNQANLERGAMILAKCAQDYKDGVRFDRIKKYARKASLPDSMDGIVPDMYL